MNELSELTYEEKMTTGSGFLLDPFVIDLVGLLNNFRNGFGDGIRDAIKKS
ncbi:MAG: hypothetical protein JST75_15945 [Bacteroidetes bacterium]|nr:hypothetical protein [Bacteroidota bacterium]